MKTKLVQSKLPKVSVKVGDYIAWKAFGGEYNIRQLIELDYNSKYGALDVVAGDINNKRNSVQEVVDSYAGTDDELLAVEPSGFENGKVVFAVKGVVR